MNLVRRIVLMAAALGIFHSSLVPPVKQNGGALCGYHEFMERGWPFTREYGATGVDGIALLTEYGIILSLATLVYLSIGLLLDRNCTSVEP
jgi:hypothetical protein